MELRHLRYFVAVAEELHFGRAAKRLHITQPPLSQQIQLLERDLGVKLLLRGRKLILTEAGRVFLDEARRTIEVADRAARAARAAAAGAVTQLRVGYPATTLFELAPAVLRTFAERFPDVGVEAAAGSTSELLSALGEDQLDVAFVHTSGNDTGTVRFALLHREPLVVAVPDDHQLTTHISVGPDDLVKEPVILLPRSLASVRERLLPDLDRPDHVSDLTETSTLEATYSAVAARLGVAVVPASTARTIAVTGVAHRPWTEPDPMLELSVAWRCRPNTRVVRSFVDLALELAASLLGDPGAGLPRFPRHGDRDVSPKEPATPLD
jgi:DNA-binding transcriptional LysR family regulator